MLAFRGSFSLKRERRGEDVLVNPLSEGPATAGRAVGFRIRRYERCAPFWPSLLSAGHAFRPLSALVTAPQDLSQPAEPYPLQTCIRKREKSQAIVAIFAIGSANEASEMKRRDRRSIY